MPFFGVLTSYTMMYNSILKYYFPSDISEQREPGSAMKWFFPSPFDSDLEWAPPLGFASSPFTLLVETSRQFVLSVCSHPQGCLQHGRRVAALSVNTSYPVPPSALWSSYQKF